MSSAYLNDRTLIKIVCTDRGAEYSSLMIRLVYHAQTYSLIPAFRLPSEKIILAKDTGIPYLELSGTSYALVAGDYLFEGKCRAAQWGLMSLAETSGDSDLLFKALPVRLEEFNLMTFLISAKNNSAIIFKLSDYMKLTATLIRLKFQLGSDYYWGMIEKM